MKRDDRDLAAKDVAWQILLAFLDDQGQPEPLSVGCRPFPKNTTSNKPWN
jgi:hypothetical protein